MRDEILEQVRKRIEAKYTAALQGLDAIADFMGESDTISLNGISPNGTSNRDRVFAVMQGKPSQTIGQIAQKSGLEAGAVRGVLYAPSLKTQFRKKKRGKTVSFRLMPKRVEGGDAR